MWVTHAVYAQVHDLEKTLAITLVTICHCQQELCENFKNLQALRGGLNLLKRRDKRCVRYTGISVRPA